MSNVATPDGGRRPNRYARIAMSDDRPSPQDLSQPLTLDLRLMVDRNDFMDVTKDMKAEDVATYLGMVVGQAINKAAISQADWEHLRKLGIMAGVKSI